MVKNRKLAKQISDVAWGQFLTLLEYKGDIYGCEIKRVDRFFPSSTSGCDPAPSYGARERAPSRCSNCGYIKEDLTLKHREWTCPECGMHHDRDINACHNLLQFSNPKIPLEERKFTPNQAVEMQCIKSVSS